MVLDFDNQDDLDPVDEEELEEHSQHRLAFVAVTVVAFTAGLWIAYWISMPRGEEGQDKAAAEAIADLPSGEDKPPESSQVVVEQEGTGEINFSPSYAVLQGDNLKRELVGTVNQLTGWQGPEDVAVWHFRVEQPAIFRVDVYYAADPAWEGGRYTLQVDDDKPVLGEVRSAGSTTEFRRDEEFVQVSTSGKHTLKFMPQQLKGEGLMILRSIQLIPRRQEPAG